MSISATVYHDNIGRVDLRDSDRIASGGEGAVYSFGPRPEMVAKVYHSSMLDAARRKKLDLMIAYRPVVRDASDGHVFVAWPHSLLRDGAGGDAVGFLMPRVDTGRTLHTYLIPAVRSSKAPETSYADLCAIGRHFSETLDKLHGGGYVLGDINESNALVTDGNRAALIDADSFQVTDHQERVVYRCEVGKPEYTAPELQGVRFGDVDRTYEHDRFALGVVIYQLLMEGQHPFNLKMPGNVSLKQPERIVRGYFAHGSTTPYGPEPERVPFDSLHVDLQDMFLRCFESGHRDPGQRPSALEWASALDSALSDIERCRTNEGHWRFSSKTTRAYSVCVWCERAQTLGFDSFANATGGSAMPRSVFRSAPSALTRMTAHAPAVGRTTANPTSTTRSTSGSAPPVPVRGTGRGAAVGSTTTAQPAAASTNAKASGTGSKVAGNQNISVQEPFYDALVKSNGWTVLKFTILSIAIVISMLTYNEGFRDMFLDSEASLGEAIANCVFSGTIVCFIFTISLLQARDPKAKLQIILLGRRGSWSIVFLILTLVLIQLGAAYIEDLTSSQLALFQFASGLLWLPIFTISSVLVFNKFTKTMLVICVCILVSILIGLFVLNNQYHSL